MEIVCFSNSKKRFARAEEEVARANVYVWVWVRFLMGAEVVSERERKVENVSRTRRFAFRTDRTCYGKLFQATTSRPQQVVSDQSLA